MRCLKMMETWYDPKYAQKAELYFTQRLKSLYTLSKVTLANEAVFDQELNELYELWHTKIQVWRASS